MSAEELKKNLSAFNAYRHYSFFAAFTENLDDKVVHIHIFTAKKYDFVNPATAVNSKTEKGVKSPLAKQRRLKRKNRF